MAVYFIYIYYIHIFVMQYFSINSFCTSICYLHKAQVFQVDFKVRDEFHMLDRWIPHDLLRKTCQIQA